MSIVFNRVSKRFGRRAALHDLSFSAEHGAITGLLGRNGAGKTTALRIAVGLDYPTDGSVSIDGLPFEKLNLGHAGVALNPSFPPTRRVIEQLSLSAFVGGASRADIAETLRETELEGVAHKRCMSLSLGMKQRLMLACATVIRPKVLILDEPVNGLDPDGISWLHEYLKKQASEGVAVLVSSHYLNDLQTYVDKVVVIQNTVLWQGTWPSAEEPDLASLFQRVTKGIAIS